MRPHSTHPRQQFVKLCECGCGQPTLLAPVNYSARGYVRGQPLQWLQGHATRRRQRQGTGHRYLTRGGYILIHMPEHPHARSNGYVPEHRLVMEEQLGRYLRRDEVVAHLDDIPWHNDPANLIVTTQADHMRTYHHELLVRAARRRSKGDRWARQHDACLDCGTTEVPHLANGRCRVCYRRRRTERERKPPCWARHHDACRECGTTARKHGAFGLCEPCYHRARQRLAGRT